MKTCLKYLILLGLFIQLTACETIIDECDLVFHERFITRYTIPNAVIIREVSDSTVFVTFGGESVSKSTNSQLYDELSTLYNDLSFNRWLGCGPPVEAFYDSIVKLQVISLDDFDITHPSGSDVSEYIEFRYVSLFDFVQNGYKEEEKNSEDYYKGGMEYFYSMLGAKVFKGNLAEINQFNTKLIYSWGFMLRFTQSPEIPDTYRFKIIAQVREKVMETSVSCDF